MIDKVSGQLWASLCFCHLSNNIPVPGQPDLSRDKNIFPLKSLFWRLFCSISTSYCPNPRTITCTDVHSQFPVHEAVLTCCGGPPALLSELDRCGTPCALGPFRAVQCPRRCAGPRPHGRWGRMVGCQSHV